MDLNKERNTLILRLSSLNLNVCYKIYLLEFLKIHANEQLILQEFVG